MDNKALGSCNSVQTERSNCTCCKLHVFSIGNCKASCTKHPIPQGFSCFQLKVYIKAVTQFCEVESWRTLMVECVTLF